MFVKNQEFHGKCASEPLSYTRFHNMVDMLLTYFLTYLHFAAQSRKVFKERERRVIIGSYYIGMSVLCTV